MSHRARLRTILLRVVVAAAIVGWFIWLRPQQLGGPAAYLVISGTSMESEYHPGDIVVVERSDAYAVGDIVAYRVPAGEPAAGAQVFHRIVGGDTAHGFLMRGDNTNGPDQWHPTGVDVIGRTFILVPGLAKLLLLLRNPVLLASLAAAFVAAWLLLPTDGPAPTAATSRSGSHLRVPLPHLHSPI